MAITTKNDMLDPQILIEAVEAEFKGKNAFIGSALKSAGAVIVEGSMPESGQNAIGKKITVPYFGLAGDFVDNPDGSAVTPTKLGQTSEEATIARSSIAVETSTWAQGIGAVGNGALGDVYAETARQAGIRAARKMDSLIIGKFTATPLVRDIASAGAPRFMSYSQAIAARTMWGDSQEGIVAMVVHSQTQADLANYSDAQGRPLLTDVIEGQPGAQKFNGIPLVVSDRVDTTGSSMGPVASVGTTPPVLTLTGTPTGPWDLRVKCTVAGAFGTAQVVFSTDGGSTWSNPVTPSAATVAFDLTDTAIDSQVGNDGTTGLQAAFAAGSFALNNRWGSTAILMTSSLIVQAGAGAFWYNAAALRPQTDHDILSDTDVLAMHLYAAPHLYRRPRGGKSKRPGVARIRHNVSNYVGTAVDTAALAAL